MMMKKLVATLAITPWLTMGFPGVEVAQSSDPYADWVYLYEDTFENNQGQEVTQEWWLKPETIRRNSIVQFTLLARRTPISSNGTAAAVFDYIADCETMSYALEKTTFLDSSDATLDVQTFQRAMEPSNPEERFHEVLTDLCGGVY
jgi:hypothetical protein